MNWKSSYWNILKEILNICQTFCSPTTSKCTNKLRTGCEDIWHSYRPEKNRIFIIFPIVLHFFSFYQHPWLMPTWFQVHFHPSLYCMLPGSVDLLYTYSWRLSKYVCHDVESMPTVNCPFKNPYQWKNLNQIEIFKRKLNQNITVLLPKFFALHRRNADFPTIAVTLCGMFASKYGPINSVPTIVSVVSPWPLIQINSFEVNN